MEKNEMFNNEGDFKKIVDRLNIDSKPSPAHRENLRRQMLSEFNEAAKKSIPRIITFKTIGRTIMKSRITKFAAAAVIIIAVIIGIHQFGGSIESVAWADVIEKLQHDIKSTNTIHVLLTMRIAKPERGENGEVKSVDTHTIKGKMWLRRKPFAGKSVLEGEQTNYFIEHKWVGLDHRGKKWFEQSIPKEKTGKNMYGIFDALVTGDFKAHQRIPGFDISDGQVIGSEIIAGERATIYEFTATPSEGKKEEGHPPIYFKCWVRDSDHKTVRMYTHYGEPDKFSTNYELIEYDVTIPPGILEVKIPEGYTKHLTLEERIKATVPTNVIELTQAYDKARKNFPDYSMIVTDKEGFVEFQIARQGKNWRRDLFERYRLEKKGILLDLSLDFDELWTQVIGWPREDIESTYMTYGNKAAVGFWPKKSYNDLPENRYTRLPDYSSTLGVVNTLEEVAWPKIENIHSPDAEVSVLSPSGKSPGCTGIRVAYVPRHSKRNDSSPVAVLVIYWIDPSRDYICVRFERHQRKTALWENNLAWESDEPIVGMSPGVRGNSVSRYHSTIVEITATAQSPEGNWYPNERLTRHHRVNERGERVEHPRSIKIERFYIDTQGSVDPSWFEWPEELPPPSK